MAKRRRAKRPRPWKQAELETALWRWQRILRLMDWEIVVRLANQGELSNSNAYGETRTDAMGKTSLVLILPLEQRSPDGGKYDYDLEATLVHELLHLHWWILNRKYDMGTPGYIAMEQAIELTAKALIDCDRAPQHRV